MDLHEASRIGVTAPKVETVATIAVRTHIVCRKAVRPMLGLVTRRICVYPMAPETADVEVLQICEIGVHQNSIACLYAHHARVEFHVLARGTGKDVL